MPSFWLLVGREAKMAIEDARDVTALPRAVRCPVFLKVAGPYTVKGG